MFGKKVSEFEIDVDTNSYHLATRFAKFCNVPELTSILSSVSDFYHVDNSMGLPVFDGYTDSVAPGSEDFKDYCLDNILTLKDFSEKSLENMISDYGSYLKNKGIPKEISNNFEKLLNQYTDFMNNYAKHHDKTSVNVLEYIMYQTGNIIRLLITLKKQENNNAN